MRIFGWLVVIILAMTRFTDDAVEPTKPAISAAAKALCAEIIEEADKYIVKVDDSKDE